MPVIKLINNTLEQVSTTIGTVGPGIGHELIVQYDTVPIPLQLYVELEALRQYNRIEYYVNEDPGMRDEIELAPYILGLIQFFNKVGEPTDGSFADGFFNYWTQNTLIADSVDQISELLLQIAPTSAGLLTGLPLSITGATQYSAKIPVGNVGAWPTPGTTINNLIVVNTYGLYTPDPLTRFKAGKANDLTTAGLLEHLVNGSVIESYDIGVHGAGTIGNITIDSLTVYGVVWLKANAHVAVIQLTAGRQIHALKHSEAGQSANTELVYDDVNSAQSFLGVPTAILNTKVSKWLSGIEAWGFGTTIDIAYTGAVGIFTKTYHPVAVGLVSCPGHDSTDNPATTPNVGDTFPIARTATLDIVDRASIAPSMQFTLQKPARAPLNSLIALPQPINTCGTLSTPKSDVFFDEVQRVVLGSGTYSGNATPFNSTIPLVNGNAQQRHNGILQYPNPVDYPGFSGSQQYERFIAKIAASTGQLTFVNLVNLSQISPYGTGNLNVLIHLSTTGRYFDLGKPVGAINGTGSGNSMANSIGGKNQTLSHGNVLAWSIGTSSTALNNNEYRLIIIFRTNIVTLTGISEV